MSDRPKGLLARSATSPSLSAPRSRIDAGPPSSPLFTLIADYQWGWEWEITESIEKVTPKTVIDKWRRVDPICRRYAWCNVLMNFGSARARVMGWTKAIRSPVRKRCLLCGLEFREDAVHPSLIKRLGFDNIDFCPPCLYECSVTRDNDMSQERILQYIRELVRALGHVPPRSFIEDGLPDLIGLRPDERVCLLTVMRQGPSTACVKQAYGTWLNAPIEAGVLEDGTRRTARGIQTLARDGHVCFSLGEKTIDDLLFAHGIAHEKEPPYPEGNYRADFLVGHTFIEYFGLAGDSQYDAKTAKKMDICKKHGVALIALGPRDLVEGRKLQALTKRVLQLGHES